MISFDKFEIWFVTGSQHLYGPETLKQVERNAAEIAEALSEAMPVKIVPKIVATRSHDIAKVCREADAAEACIGLVCWMHTFSPAKMWIAGLSSLNKPFVHLHTQYNREIPWSDIDMDFMNLNQSAHGDREFGFICSRLRLNRKIVVGHWQDRDVRDELGVWVRAAAAVADSRGAKVARFGDNMRDVAVTEGDKVEAQIRFGYEVLGFGVGDLAVRVKAVSDAEIKGMVEQYFEAYDVSRLTAKPDDPMIREAARIEVGMRQFLEEGGFKAFTTTFEDLHGLAQLPGLACQRLMADGYGFGAEGDWKTAMLVRSMKVMGAGLQGGTSFMEDYTYHLPENGEALVLGAHMLEVCPSIAGDKPSLELHPLSIGGKDDPARLVFSAMKGAALNATIVDMGNRFRMLVNPVEVVDTPSDLPKLPVARALWRPEPNLKVSATAWILGGGAHHSGFSQSVTVEHLRDFAGMMDVEMLEIDRNTDIRAFKGEIRANEVYYK
ncbi:L-arabinose isomerase [Pseudodesulfovibrio indicus]|uniref:L-arabinose isomerase n=1 Tax=Pseudodesulfovibrio indicus TaxID=1716143 RepID=UPI00292E2C9F|nr:L-arabinose isomerase [Pseudodesulfovibrio indicus]